ncbi:HAD-like domain-containing protein [Hygrophoropsis aurantiaca]|uniref:HAD-like domain-containing protein n=1 Tax=Hygrophoropsis aurantiaca TaxID=72124 RepID=A0ACB7ZWW5_9AGAM|nr:HAD-like domain-containing protein [Hygrophoropsis aurantiaca]
MGSEAPESTLPYPPLHVGKKFVVLSDWDGTITDFDSNDYLTDNIGFGLDERRRLNELVLKGQIGFRDAFRLMLDSVANGDQGGADFEFCKDMLRKNIKVDGGFSDFYQWTTKNDVPFVIVSSGMTPIIRAVLDEKLGGVGKDVDIISNDVDIAFDGRWSIKYRHPTSTFGHDKSQAILPYKALQDPPTLFFFGDGVSDMSAAQHADVLFVKVNQTHNDLAMYCENNGIQHIKFTSFADAAPVVEAIVKGQLDAKKALKAGSTKAIEELLGV